MSTHYFTIVKRGDLIPQGVAQTKPRIWRVCQFRHFGTFCAEEEDYRKTGRRGNPQKIIPPLSAGWEMISTWREMRACATRRIGSGGCGSARRRCGSGVDP